MQKTTWKWQNTAVLLMGAILSFAVISARAGLVKNAERTARSPSQETTGEASDPYSSILERIHSINVNVVKETDAAFLLTTADSIHSVGAEFHLRRAAGMAYACLNKFDVYRSVRKNIGNPEQMEQNALESCPKCRGEGKVDDPVFGIDRCKYCKGEGWRVKNRNMAKQRLRMYLERSEQEISRLHEKWLAEQEELKRKEEIRKKEEEERARREKEEQEQKARREEQLRRDREFAERQRAKGLVLYDGKWMTPSEKEQAEKRARFFRLIDNRSLNNCVYSILQIIGDGKALCVNRRNGNTFCLLYSTDNAHNRAIAEGDILRNDLWWCGTYTYTTVRNAQSTVAMFAIDADVALREAIRQGYFED